MRSIPVKLNGVSHIGVTGDKHDIFLSLPIIFAIAAWQNMINFKEFIFHLYIKWNLNSFNFRLSPFAGRQTSDKDPRRRMRKTIKSIIC